MAQLQQEDTTSHFAHPEHELVMRHYTGPFLCDMCWEDLSGPAYGCSAGCDFCIHESCADHTQELTSPEHHAHPLVLSQTSRDGDGDGAALVCDVCVGRCAPGCFLYRCPPCEFDMHPRCARLPEVVRSARHSEHDLALVAAAAAACGGVGGERAWYYRCTACDVDYHVLCAATADGGASQAGSDADAMVEQIHQASAA